jgi:AcrR family transcriptional regulator
LTLVDGRSARRDRNRDIGLDAALELFAEGHVEPSAVVVAARAGVSERSVFRYFEDTDALLRAAIARHLERTLPLFDVPGLGEGTFDERVERFVHHRMKLYEAVAPTARAATYRAHTNELIAAQLTDARHRLRAQLEAMFEPELSAIPAARGGADSLFQFEAVEHLCVHLELTPARARESLEHALTALLQLPS